MNRVHGKLINTANPLDLFQLCVPARMMWDMQLTKASDWLTPHPLVSLPVSVGSQSNPPADICALTICSPWVWCNAGLLYVFTNYWDGLLLLREFGSRSHLDNKWELIGVDDKTRHEHKCWTTCTLNGYVAPVDLHFHFKSAPLIFVTSQSFIQALQGQINKYFSKVAAAFLHRSLVFSTVTRSHKAFVTIATLACFPLSSSCRCVSVFPSQPLSEWARFTGSSSSPHPTIPLICCRKAQTVHCSKSIFNNHSAKPLVSGEDSRLNRPAGTDKPLLLCPNLEFIYCAEGLKRWAS